MGSSFFGNGQPATESGSYSNVIIFLIPFLNANGSDRFWGRQAEALFTGWIIEDFVWRSKKEAKKLKG
jgi:type IV secretory pathway TraG/TraD family ATPase VirD4